MATQLTTPIKQIIKKQLKKVDSQQALLPVTFQEQISSRLRQNAKIIQMISSNKFERSRSRRKEHLEALQTVEGEASKKLILDEIMNKLDSALKQSKTSMQISRRCHSQQRQFEQKVRQFQNTLRQIKQSNIEAQQKIKTIKNQFRQSEQFETKQSIKINSSRRVNQSNLTTRLPIQYKTQYRFKDSRGVIRQKQKKTQSRYQVKGSYVYPKYVRPQKRIVLQVCIQPNCRKSCCYRRGS